MITLKTAVQYLTDGIHGCGIPVDPHAFRRKRDTQDHLFFGPTPIRAYKNANRWKFDERDIHQAARTLTALPWDPDDLIDAGIPQRNSEEEAHPLRPDWRQQIRHTIDHAAYRTRLDHGCACSSTSPVPCTGPTAGPDGLPCGLTRTTLLDHTRAHTFACIQPIPSLRWNSGTWLLPRTLVLILDQWQEAESELNTAAGQCSNCKAHGNALDWRTATTNGWRVLCPACSSTSLRPYRDELQGTLYTQVREHGPSAEDFLCTLCDTPRPASYWDHCHDHNLIRGPLCAGCNGLEYHGKEFLTRPRSVPHLLRCDGCRKTPTLPQHHRPGAVRRHLHHHAAPNCEWPAHMEVLLTERDDGGYDYTLRCTAANIRRQQGTLTAAEVQDILHRLTAQQ